MIADRWYAVLQSNELRKGKKAGIRRFGEDLVLWRGDDGKIACVADKCIHRGASLSCGTVVKGRIKCPFHGFEFDPSGRCTLIPANGSATPVPSNFKTASYAARESHGYIWLFFGTAREDLPEINFFKDIDDSFSYTQMTSRWPVHYTRCIENQLDLVHLPFVHKTTIGSGGKTLVNGPYVKSDTSGIKFWVNNERDNGQNPAGPEDIKPPEEGRVHIEFLFPNLWQNWISDKLRIFISFTPVDDSNTILYMRVYQKIFQIPVLVWFFNAMMLAYSVIILNQDRRVVITQKPVKTSLAMDENLITGDLPIIKYRMIRDELLKKNNKEM
ncbi:MAG TPA: aromatic ring-hydroxylating dioxygenase subunit alpha [Candidatus Wallbacteria bacterium]|nr:aromatic ring-hydroxylating dioxygenase subunit alpha [Candidatus Wallbacteria bacterium]